MNKTGSLVLFFFVGSHLIATALAGTIDGAQISQSGSRVTVALHIGEVNAKTELTPGECKTPKVSTADLWSLSRPTQVTPVCRPERAQQLALRDMSRSGAHAAGSVTATSYQRLNTLDASYIAEDLVVKNITTRKASLDSLGSKGTGKPFTQLAAPAIPDPKLVKNCLVSSFDGNANPNASKFNDCIVTTAMPSEYILTKACLANSSYDAAEVALCSAGKASELKDYQRLKDIRACLADKEVDVLQAAGCIGLGGLSERDQAYARCILDNDGNLGASAICAIGINFTPEQRIALACAVETGGQPHAFIACTGGQLLKREIGKCLEHGIGGKDGCYGENNEFRKFYSTLDDVMGNALGRNNDAYRAWKFMKDNVYSPGQNHEVVKALNTGLNDLKNGPGENNDIIKAANILGREYNIVSTDELAVTDKGVKLGRIELKW